METGVYSFLMHGYTSLVPQKIDRQNNTSKQLLVIIYFIWGLMGQQYSIAYK